MESPAWAEPSTHTGFRVFRATSSDASTSAAAPSEKGETSLGGRIPVNTSGGLKAKGHPIGATGAAQVAEIATQLRGEAGRRQVEDAKVGLTHTLGGNTATVLVSLFGSEPR